MLGSDICCCVASLYTNSKSALAHYLICLLLIVVNEFTMWYCIAAYMA